MTKTPRKFWTQERLDEALRLWNEGWSASQIADKMGGLTRAAVVGKMFRMKLPKREGYPSKGVRIIPHNVSTWNKDRDEQALAYYNDDGMSPEAIGVAMGIARSTVVRRLRQLGAVMRGRKYVQGSPKRKPSPDAPMAPRPSHLSVWACLGQSVSLMELTAHSCRWPQELATGETNYCGRTKVQGSYCDYHADLAYRAFDPKPDKSKPRVDYRPSRLTMNGRAI